jgi:hypothetical protein
VNDLLEGAPLDVPHDERDAGHPEVEHLVNPDDVGVIELGEEARLACEAGDRLLVLEVLGEDDLDRHLVPGLAIACQIDDRGSTAPDLLEDIVVGSERRERSGSAFAAHRRKPDV